MPAAGLIFGMHQSKLLRASLSRFMVLPAGSTAEWFLADDKVGTALAGPNSPRRLELLETPACSYALLPADTLVACLMLQVKGAMKSGTSGNKMGPVKTLPATHSDGGGLKILAQVGIPTAAVKYIDTHSCKCCAE